MDLSKLDPDFFIRHAAYTRGTHRDVYPAIDPRSPNLSQSGKVVIITGASSGIGATGLAPAFAQADARAIALVGRRSEKLAEVATKLRQDYPAVEIMEAPLSITDADAVEALLASIISKFSTIDVLINNAGVLSRHSEILATNVESWWNGFETNVLGTYLVTRSFLKALGKEKHGTIINVSSGAAAVVQPGASSYSVSKVAIERLSEFVAAEYPNVTSVALEPGTVDTDMILKFALDKPLLAGGTAVWLASAQAHFLTGRSVSANWDMDEMVLRKDAILKDDQLKWIRKGQSWQ